MTFLTEKDVKAEVRRQLKAGSSLKAAVAFWGNGAGETLQLHDHGGKIEIVCNLMMGGTNPNEIEKLLKNKDLAVKQRDDLHAKVYLFDNAAIVGSSNASSSGLSYQDTDDLSWREANILATDAWTLKTISRWMDTIFQGSKAISNADLIKAKEIWSSRRALNRLPSPTGKTLLEIAKNNPAAFEGRRVFVTYCDDEDYDEDVKAAIAKKKIELNLPKNSNHLEAYQDWDDIPKDALLIEFHLRNKSGRVSLSSISRTPKNLKSVKLRSGRTIQFVSLESTIMGLTLGKKTEWDKAAKRALPELEKKGIIPLNEFAAKYFTES